MIGVVLLIQMSMACHRGFYHFAHKFSHVDVFGSLLHINCQQSYWFLHDLVECPGWRLVERFFDSEDFCVPLHSVIVITTISPSKFVSYLYLRETLETEFTSQGPGCPSACSQNRRLCLCVLSSASFGTREMSVSCAESCCSEKHVSLLTSHTWLSSSESDQVLMGEGQRMCSARFVLEKL